MLVNAPEACGWMGGLVGGGGPAARPPGGGST